MHENSNFSIRNEALQQRMLQSAEFRLVRSCFICQAGKIPSETQTTLTLFALPSLLFSLNHALLAASLMLPAAHACTLLTVFECEHTFQHDPHSSESVRCMLHTASSVPLHQQNGEGQRKVGLIVLERTNRTSL